MKLITIQCNLTMITMLFINVTSVCLDIHSLLLQVSLLSLSDNCRDFSIAAIPRSGRRDVSCVHFVFCQIQFCAVGPNWFGCFCNHCQLFRPNRPTTSSANFPLFLQCCCCSFSQFSLHSNLYNFSLTFLPLCHISASINV